MKLLVLGATGGTGRALVGQGLGRGHQVTALARSPDKIAPRPDLTVRGGDPRDAEQVSRALEGQDAVLSALGPRSSADATLLADCAQSTVAAMRRGGVRRLIVISSALLFPNLGPLAAILRLVLRSVLADSRRMEGLVEASSDIEWTIVRPPRLTNGAHTGHYRVAAGELPRGGGVISRSDLANFVLDEAERRNHLRALVGVCA